jgi:hypothetical protein
MDVVVDMNMDKRRLERCFVGNNKSKLKSDRTEMHHSRESRKVEIPDL